MQPTLLEWATTIPLLQLTLQERGTTPSNIEDASDYMNYDSASNDSANNDGRDADATDIINEVGHCPFSIVETMGVKLSSTVKTTGVRFSMTAHESDENDVDKADEEAGHANADGKDANNDEKTNVKASDADLAKSLMLAMMLMIMRILLLRQMVKIKIPTKMLMPAKMPMITIVILA